MRHPHTAAYGYVKAHKLSFFDNGDEAQILGEYIHIVGRRNRDTDFKLARQIDRPVDRLLLFLIALAIDYIFSPSSQIS